jgi:predicted dehydrogenase
LIGRRRAAAAAGHPRSRCILVVDSDPAAAQALACEVDAKVSPSWQALIADPAVQIVCVATPNGFLAEIACAALGAGKHVLLEKPMGRNVDEAHVIAAAAQTADRCVKVGFNHRYHPAIARAHEELVAGTIGTPINARARYGHGGRPGYEREWRGDARLAGGGELTDQGVHIADLLHWFLGVPSEVYAVTQTAVWPLGALEDNGFAIVRYGGGQIAAMHTSWTQWKNLFSLEIFGERGSLVIEGLGGSYGEETLTIAHRAMQGGAPRMERLAFPGPDQSWTLEWDDFLGGVLDDRPYLGGAEDGLIAMATLDALYRSARDHTPVTFTSGKASQTD